jgi:uncharacterized protein (TIGR02594 family)
MIIDPRAVQARLKQLGFDPGALDGVLGPRTRVAVIRFQTVRGLTPDGIVGPLTRSALFGAATAAPRPAETVPTEMPWLIEADRLRGLKETPGRPSNPVIIDWAADMAVPYADDDVPWCGLFVGHCLRSALPEADLPANILSARSWLQFGTPVTPQLGAIMVFWRGAPSGWQGHVGFCWAEDDACFHILGGNQSDSVSITRIARQRLLGARSPTGIHAPGIRRTASAEGKLISINES